MENIEWNYWSTKIEVANKQLELLDKQITTEELKQKILKRKLEKLYK